MVSNQRFLGSEIVLRVDVESIQTDKQRMYKGREVAAFGYVSVCLLGGADDRMENCCAGARRAGDKQRGETAFTQR